MQRNPLRLLASFLSLSLALPLLASTPTISQPAPALTFTHLLQAPPSTKIDWFSLRGKVVVLEFWATWCAPCVAEIPHLNALAQSLASSNIQFIAVDDEDPAVVTPFLARKPISGWVGLDTTSRILNAYGVEFRPATFVIDTQGRIAASLDSTLLNKDQLLALAAGQPVTFPGTKQPANQNSVAGQPNPDAGPAVSANTSAKPLFEISISQGDPSGEFSWFMHTRKDGGGYYYDLKNTTLATLFRLMAGVPASRLVIHQAAHQDASNATYSFHIALPGTNLEDLAPAIQLALASAAGMKLTHESTLQDAYLLQSTPMASTLLTPTASKQGSICYYNAATAKLSMVKTTLNGLAPRLEEALGFPVVNETAIQGEFDANLDLPKGNLPAIKAALEANLGLTLVKARRPIDRIVLDPLTAPGPPIEPGSAPRE
jgi:uncharacterized protein (TIGR03435 family)